MADITISWDADNETLTAAPSPYYAGPPRPGVTKNIIWEPGDGVDNIQGIRLSCMDGEAYPADGTQPEPTGNSKLWRWTDPETGTDTYEYIVSASVHDIGVKTLDPAIINRSG